MTKSRADYDASLKILRTNVDLFHSGNREVYRVIATELFKLLCDKSPLVLRIFHEFQLHKLHMADFLEKYPEMTVALANIQPGRVEFNPVGHTRCRLTFTKSLEKIDLQNWIEQPFFSMKITIRELIKSVRDKEASHADPTYGPTLSEAKQYKLVNEDSHVPWIIAIAEYLLDFIRLTPLQVKEEHA